LGLCRDARQRRGCAESRPSSQSPGPSGMGVSFPALLYSLIRVASRACLSLLSATPNAEKFEPDQSLAARFPRVAEPGILSRNGTLTRASIRRGRRSAAARSAGSPRVRATVLLKAGGAQAGKAMRLIGALPGAKLLLGKLVALAGFLEGDLAALHGGHDRRLAADHPSSGVGRRQLTH
jgi:hypothetical protein